MRIEEVETLLFHQFPVVVIHTDNGITGVGEGTFFAGPEATLAVVRSFRPYLLGQDPLRIQHHWRYLHRAFSFWGSALFSALGAVDTALWDIAGKFHGVPVADLLSGGRLRDWVRMCALALADDLDEMVRRATEAVREGHTAVKIDPFPSGWADMSAERLVREALRRTSAVREAVGPDVDVCVEAHRKLNPALAVYVASALEPFHILFLEDPTVPDDAEALREISAKSPVPIAAGERHVSLQDFRRLLEAGVRTLKPDVGLAGGLTNCLAVAVLARAWQAHISPHNFLGPVCTAAHVHLCASIPNSGVLEYLPDVPPKSDMVKRPLPVEEGFIKVPDAPGLGVEPDLDALRNAPFTPREPRTPLRRDGSVAHDF